MTGKDHDLAAARSTSELPKASFSPEGTRPKKLQHHGLGHRGPHRGLAFLTIGLLVAQSSPSDTTREWISKTSMPQPELRKGRVLCCVRRRLVDPPPLRRTSDWRPNSAARSGCGPNEPANSLELSAPRGLCAVSARRFRHRTRGLGLCRFARIADFSKKVASALLLAAVKGWTA